MIFLSLFLFEFLHRTWSLTLAWLRRSACLCTYVYLYCSQTVLLLRQVSKLSAKELESVFFFGVLIVLFLRSKKENSNQIRAFQSTSVTLVFLALLESYLSLWKKWCVFECGCNSVCACIGETERERESCCAFVCLPCPCLRLMSQPLRGWHWNVVPFWTIALARVSDNTVSSVVKLAPSLCESDINRIMNWEVK